MFLVPINMEGNCVKFPVLLHSKVDYLTTLCAKVVSTSLKMAAAVAACDDSSDLLLPGITLILV